MKNCLLVGCGSKFGARITESFIDQNYHVHLMTGSGKDWANQSNVTVLDVEWKTMNLSTLATLVPNIPQIDIVLFNHNASALDIEKFSKGKPQNIQHWQQSYFVACQFPYFYIQLLSKKITTETKIGWMLSELIATPLINQIGYADYIGNKFTNACIMKSFSIKHGSCFFGLHPDGGAENNPAAKAKGMVDLMINASATKLNGNIFDSQGNILDIFK